MGDSIHATPLLRGIKTLYPEATIDLIAQARFAALARHYPGVRKVYPFSKQEFKGVIGKYRFGRMIAGRKKYDVFFCMAESFSSAWVGYWTGSRIRIGMNTDLRSFLLTHPVKSRPFGHNVYKTMALLEAFAPAAATLEPELRLSLDADLLERNPLPAGRNLVFCLYGTVPSRWIPHEKSVEILRFLLREYDYNILLIGVEGDQERISGILEAIGPNPRIHNYVGRTGVDELAAIIQQADLVLSVDSGPAHIANSLGVKLIDLFGAGNEAFTGPYREESTRVLRVPDLPCARCMERVCPLGDLRCLTRISLGMIKEAIEELESS